MTTSPVSLLTDAQVHSCRAPFVGDEAGLGAMRTPRGNLPLAAVDVRASIVGLLAGVELVQTFKNVHAEPLETTYVFPLPDRAAVSRFTVKVAGRLIEGVLKERGQAREEYDAAIATGHRAAIAEEERPGTFTMRVGNLMPGETAEVTLGLSHPLPIIDGEATFQFPLVVAPRYIPGAPLGGEQAGLGTSADTSAVPDASRISPPVLLPGFPSAVRLGITVDLDPAGLILGGIASSLHAVTIGEGRRTITVQPGERLNRDFILRLAYGADAVSSSLVTSSDGTFALTLVPPPASSRATRPRDVIFVLDRSGSMSGWKMVASRRACARMIDTLSDKDRFTVYAFDNNIEQPPQHTGLVAATDRNRHRTVEWLGKVDDAGGTEMAEPLRRAAATLAGSEGRDAILVLITDGQVGNEDQILATMAAHAGKLRIFTVGVDRAVNAGFLRRLAAFGGGSCELLESEDRLDEAMDRLHRRIGTPVVEQLVLDGAIDLATVSPRRLPALFAGAPLVITGKTRGQLDRLLVRGVDQNGADWVQQLGATRSDTAAIKETWGRAHLRDLEDRYAIGENHLESRIVQVSLETGVLCRFTAFVAVDRSEIVNQGGRQKQVVQPVESPDGWAKADDMTQEVLAMPAAMPVMAELAAPGRASGAKKMAMPARAAAPAPSSPVRAPAPPSGAAPPPSPMLRRHEEPAPVVLPPIDLTAYRVRGRDILRLVDAPEQRGRARRLLEVLLHDLRSIDQALPELEKLLQGQDWAAIKLALEAFVNATDPPPVKKKSRLAFWK